MWDRLPVPLPCTARRSGIGRPCLSLVLCLIALILIITHTHVHASHASTRSNSLARTHDALAGVGGTAAAVRTTTHSAILGDVNDAVTRAEAVAAAANAHSDEAAARAVWELDSARMASVSQMSSTVSDEHASPAYHVRWLPPPLTTLPDAPPLLYSLFAEWRLEEDLVHAPSDGERKGHISVRACHSIPSLSRDAAGASTAPVASCVIPAGVLPVGGSVRLRVMTECDYERMMLVTVAANHSRDSTPVLPQRCLASLSPPLRLRLPRARAQVRATAFGTSTPPLATPRFSGSATLASERVGEHGSAVSDGTRGHTQIHTEAPASGLMASAESEGEEPRVRATNERDASLTDDTVRTTLCRFFRVTKGDKWTKKGGWCDDDVPVCEWHGIACNDAANPTVLTHMMLGSNSLELASPDDDISFAWASLSGLTHLSLEGNGFLGASLNLTQLSRLRVLDVSSWMSAPTGDLLPDRSLLLLPPASQLLEADVRFSHLIFDVRRTPRLERLDAMSNGAAWQLASIWHAPNLLHLDFSHSAVNSGEPSPDGSGLIGGELTQYVLSNLRQTNPRLQFLGLQSTSLPFAQASLVDASNWPLIRAPALTHLLLRSTALYTTRQGPDPQWLSAMPRLEVLDLSVKGTTLHTNAFEFGSLHLREVLIEATLVGDLTPLYRLGELTTLVLDQSGLNSSLPHSIASLWPHLIYLSAADCNLWGSVPRFGGMASLSVVRLSGNALTVLPEDVLDGALQVQVFDVSNNPMLTGSIGRWNLPLLASLGLFDTQMGGSLPSDLWARMPNLNYVDLSSCRFEGTIPPAAVPRVMDTFIMSCNAFNGSIPANITARYYDVSFNQLSGDLSQLAPDSGFTYLSHLLLAGNEGLTCPLLLSTRSLLTHLDIHGTGLAGCDCRNASEWGLPESLEFMDMSDVVRPLRTLQLPQLPNLRILRARNASISRAILSGNEGVQEVDLSDNLLRLAGQLEMLNSLVSRHLHTLLLDRCELSMDIADIARVAQREEWPLQKISLAQNYLRGSFPGWLIVSDQSRIRGVPAAWPHSLSVILLNDNTGIRGALPEAHPGARITHLDLSGTSVEGPLPESWTQLTQLQQLGFTDTWIECPLMMESGELRCPLPSWLQATPVLVELPSSSDSSGFEEGVHCQQLGLRGSGLSSVRIDPSYSGLTLCSCDANFFGRDGICIPCPHECACSGDSVEGCWPVMQRGVVTGVSHEDGSVTVQSVTPFSLLQLLPCASTVAGDSLCNPEGRHDWGVFYRLSGGAADNDAEGSDSDPSFLDDFCYPGHTGRLCAQCSHGYFSSGRWCLRCMGEGVHALIVIANLAVLLALILYLYKQQANEQAAKAALLEYRAASSVHPPLPMSPSQSDPSTAYVMQPLPSGSGLAHPHPEVHEVDVMSSDSPPAQSVVVPSSPLRLLIFHSQQLSLLLLTSASLPPALSGLLAVFSSASSGFSLSSLTAMECLSAWTMAHRCWAALLAPLFVGLAAALAYARAHFHRASRGANPFTQPSSHSDPSHTCARRTYAVCVAMLYLLAFPCAQTALSALACTDWREAGEGSGAGQPSRVFLNLAPWQQCDAQWRREILPPALLAAIVWCLLFPVLSTLWLRRAHSRVVSDGSAVAEPHGPSLHTWTVVSDLLKPFSSRHAYWEQVLLARRLLLVACVTFVPQHSLYLPLLLLLLIQTSALLQHWAHPYRAPWLNAGELASLYLLLLNYLSALVSQAAASVSGSTSDSGSTWLICLFLLNLAFLLVLVGGLFAWVRVRVGARLWQAMRGTVCARWISSDDDEQLQDEGGRSHDHPSARSAHIPVHPGMIDSHKVARPSTGARADLSDPLL